MRALGGAFASRRTCLQRHAGRQGQSVWFLLEALAILARGDKPTAKDTGSYNSAIEARGSPRCKL